MSTDYLIRKSASEKKNHCTLANKLLFKKCACQILLIPLNINMFDIYKNAPKARKKKAFTESVHVFCTNKHLIWKN